MSELYDRGSVVTVKAEFKKNTPYGTPAYFDPSTTPKITITDPSGADKVVNQNLIQNTTGKYYYFCQTGTGWPSGIYSVKVTGGDGSYTDVTINKAAFKLT